MADQRILQVEPRAGRGSQVARKLRRAGRIPAVIYGHGAAEPVAIDEATFRHQVKPDQYGSAIVQLRRGEQALGTALVKEVQVNLLRQAVDHVDLQRVAAEELLHVSVAVVLHSEPAGTRLGGVLEQVVHAINIRCRADEVPEQVSYDVSAMEIGDALHASQLSLPSSGELLDRPDEVIAVILPPTLPVEEESVEIEPNVSGPELVGDKQKDDFPQER